MRHDAIAPISQQDRSSSQAVWSKPPAPGVPPIRLTSLEGQKKDLQVPDVAAVKAKADGAGEEEHKMPKTPNEDTNNKSVLTTSTLSEALLPARRFHLARHISSVLGPSPAGGIRKSKSFIHPPLATFVERHGSTLDHEQSPIYPGKPVDKILDTKKAEVLDGAKLGEGNNPTLETVHTSKRHHTNTFVPPRPQKLRNGTSIRDDPSTWDLESDQLADELAALAMEFDPDLQRKVDAEPLPQPAPVPQDVLMTSHDREEDYIYETYVRIPYNGDTTVDTDLQSNYGILVIDEEGEDLWQKYVDSEDDTDWDEEDSNGEHKSFVIAVHADHRTAEDNPVNDYPEDEVSSDDEYGYDPYKYHGSDNDDFGDNHYGR